MREIRISITDDVSDGQFDDAWNDIVTALHSRIDNKHDWTIEEVDE
jgi:hypothetical protein